MARTVTAAIVQVAWTGDKDSMIELHEKHVAEAAAAGARVMCFQELFYGPYFCQVQDAEYYSYAEAIPDGPTTRRFCELAAQHEMVLVVPMYEREKAGFLYNTAAVIDADGTYLGKYRKNHIPQVKGFWEKFYFRPGNLGYPVFETAVGTVGVYICYDRHFPRGLAGPGTGRSRDRVQPLGHQPWALRLSLAAGADLRCGGEHVLRRCHKPGRRRAPGRQRLLRDVVLRQPARPDRGQGRVGPGPTSSWCCDLDLEMVDEVRNQWAFYRDRRPDSYGPLTAP